MSHICRGPNVNSQHYKKRSLPCPLKEKPGLPGEDLGAVLFPIEHAATILNNLFVRCLDTRFQCLLIPVITGPSRVVPGMQQALKYLLSEWPGFV